MTVLDSPAGTTGRAGMWGPPPSRTLEQRRASLALANEVRLGRKRLKREIAARQCLPSTVLLNPPRCAETMPVYDLLLAVPLWGRTKVVKVLAAVSVSHSRTVGALSERQRRELSSMLKAAGR